MMKVLKECLKLNDGKKDFNTCCKDQIALKYKKSL